MALPIFKFLLKLSRSLFLSHSTKAPQKANENNKQGCDSFCTIFEDVSGLHMWAFVSEGIFGIPFKDFMTKERIEVKLKGDFIA